MSKHRMESFPSAHRDDRSETERVVDAIGEMLHEQSTATDSPLNHQKELDALYDQYAALTGAESSIGKHVQLASTPKHRVSDAPLFDQMLAEYGLDSSYNDLANDDESTPVMPELAEPTADNTPSPTMPDLEEPKSAANNNEAAPVMSELAEPITATNSEPSPVMPELAEPMRAADNNEPAPKMAELAEPTAAASKVEIAAATPESQKSADESVHGFLVRAKQRFAKRWTDRTAEAEQMTDKEKSTSKKIAIGVALGLAALTAAIGIASNADKDNKDNDTPEPEAFSHSQETSADYLDPFDGHPGHSNAVDSSDKSLDYIDPLVRNPNSGIKDMSRETEASSIDFMHNDAYRIPNGGGGERLMKELGQNPSKWYEFADKLASEHQESFYTVDLGDGQTDVRIAKPGPLPKDVIVDIQSYLEK